MVLGPHAEDAEERNGGAADDKGEKSATARAHRWEASRRKI